MLIAFDLAQSCNRIHSYASRKIPGMVTNKQIFGHEILPFEPSFAICRKNSQLAYVFEGGFDFTSLVLHKIIMAYKPPKKIEDKDIMKLQKEFLECDLDGDGKITREELKDVLRSLKGKMKVTENQIEKVVKEADADADGQIDLREYYHNVTNSNK